MIILCSILTREYTLFSSIIVAPMAMFIVLPSRRGHCKSSLSSFDECRLSARWLPTLKPSQTTQSVSLPAGCYHPHPPSTFIIISQPESWYSFTVPLSVEVRVDLGTAVRVCRTFPSLHITAAVMRNTTAKVRFQPGFSHTAVRHGTTRPPWPNMFPI